MLAFTLRRAIQAIGVMIAVGVIAFSMFRFAGDPVNQIVSLDTPAASDFAFSPPAGATVKEIPVPKRTEHSMPPAAKDPERKNSRSSVTGTGWETVIELPSRAGQQGSTADAPPSKDSGLTSGTGAGALLEQAAVAVPGGKLLSTALVNVLILDDGRIFAGSVPLDRLQSAAVKG